MICLSFALDLQIANILMIFLILYFQRNHFHITHGSQVCQLMCILSTRKKRKACSLKNRGARLLDILSDNSLLLENMSEKEQDKLAINFRDNDVLGNIELKKNTNISIQTSQNYFKKQKHDYTNLFISQDRAFFSHFCK